MIERAIVLPFSVDGSGSILSSNNQASIWQSRVTSAVMTSIGERVFRPQYGGFVRAAVFQTDVEASKMISDSVSEVFSKYLTDLVFNRVDSVIDQQKSTLSLTIDYTLPNQTRGEVSLTTGLLTRTGELIQEF